MLRPATRDDLEQLRRWRNHPEVRRVSLTQHEIAPEEHQKWWSAVEADPTRQVLIYERDDTPSGAVTFFDIDTDPDSAWWGYYLDNQGLEERGALFPAWISIQREAVKYAHRELGVRELHGETLVLNEAAVDFNQRLGFEEVERYERDVDGAKVTVIHSRKTWEDSRG